MLLREFSRLVDCEQPHAIQVERYQRQELGGTGVACRV
jgi:hypothetical protein